MNIGDHIQSCAAEQYLPRVDMYVERDNLNANIPSKAKIIMNGWFTDAPENWPPNPNLKPLFVSFHLQPFSAKIILSKQENIDYFKSHEPIGCRDYNTVSLLEDKGIKAYFSFCLTTTLDKKYKSDINSGEILLVDPLYSYDSSLLYKMSLKKALSEISFKKLRKLKDYLKPKSNIIDFVPIDILKKAVSINHYVSSKQNNRDLYKQAKSLLKRYAEAQLVITSRIHCALPCLALGTPVLFVLDGLKDESLHMSRFRGVLDHVNILTNNSKVDIERLFEKPMNVYSPNQIDWENPPKNPDSFKELSSKLKETCCKFIDEH
ncbi:polysaccharide pyruvyl transferase family protein [Psychroflexus sp. CAK57W]|uniref:polysaccharide pyruvyl transferase family protein n=1 Tax=Psychroflexus curvus TaxID=2873595 RepID=UPI001CCFDA89|nr:polysaccharide pyruvyl transferase family protein [Psychroflexus curvus]MBZ9627121.1 polysaccharide pyruvyl transferase family protein [Psychroflexus curvus]MBZ9787127.1 polysaccharide pyruvyl transferase family protein [Psychroflexus curvus]